MNTLQKSVMIVDDEREMLDSLAIFLKTKGGYRVEPFDKAEKALEWLELHADTPPDIIVADIGMPDMNGYEFGRKLKESSRLRRIPLVYLSGMTSLVDRIKARQIAEYLPKDVEKQELLTVIQTKLNEHEMQADIQPLTRLPGNASIAKAAETLVATRERYALLYIDLDNFKHFNDCYGVAAGDRAITGMASGIDRALVKTVGSDYFFGHVGGDDFVVMIWDNADPVAVCKGIFLEVEKLLSMLYAADDIKRGYFEAQNRKGEIEQFGLLSVSIGVVTSEVKKIKNWAEASSIFVDLKKKAKSMPGNSYYINRRSRDRNA
jgi:diguanylate cyclase (GGDEF)-like protein